MLSDCTSESVDKVRRLQLADLLYSLDVMFKWQSWKRLKINNNSICQLVFLNVLS